MVFCDEFFHTSYTVFPCQEQFVDRGAALDYGRYCFHNCVPTVMINGFLASEKAGKGWKMFPISEGGGCMVNVPLPLVGCFLMVNVCKLTIHGSTNGLGPGGSEFYCRATPKYSNNPFHFRGSQKSKPQWPQEGTRWYKYFATTPGSQWR